METSGAVLPSDADRFLELTGKDENSLKVVFHASPSVTSGFLEMFNVVSTRSTKGFDVL